MSTTVSLAVTDSVPDRLAIAVADSAYRRLGIGLRTTLLPAQPLPTPPCIAALQRAATEVSGVVGQEVANRIAQEPALAADTAALEALRGEVYELAVESLPSDQKETLTAGAAACTETLAASHGWTVDAAVAGAIEFPGAPDGTDADVGSLGVWLTPAYLGGSTSAAGVLRARWDDLHTDSTSTNLDVGVRGFHSLQRWSLSGEAVYRHTSRGDEGDDLVRLSLIFDVLLAGDTWLTLTFGRDFAAEDARSVIALANLQWNVGGRSARPQM